MLLTELVFLQWGIIKRDNLLIILLDRASLMRDREEQVLLQRRRLLDDEVEVEIA